MTDENVAEEVSISELTDEQIMAMDAPPVTVGADGADEDQAASNDSDPENPGGEADGAATDEGAAEEDGASADSTSEEEDAGSANADPFDDKNFEAPKDDQSEDDGEEGNSEEGDATDEVDFKTEYEKLMAPFKAAKREVKLGSIDDARRLMQMGVDYSSKMQVMKPHLRTLRTLEKAGLLDPEKINFLIDLDNKNPEAIKELLKSADIDPMSLRPEEDDKTYSPADHGIGDEELAVTEVLETIKDSPHFKTTVDIISDKLDTKSRVQLKDNPEVIVTIHSHVEAGVYDVIMQAVKDEKMFGRYKGVSDLEAYYQVGNAMYKRGDFKDPNASATSTPEKKPSDTAQKGSSGKSRKDQKRAAGSNNGAASSAGKSVPDFSKMSDKEIEEWDPASLG